MISLHLLLSYAFCERTPEDKVHLIGCVQRGTAAAQRGGRQEDQWAGETVSGAAGSHPAGLWRLPEGQFWSRAARTALYYFFMKLLTLCIHKYFATAVSMWNVCFSVTDHGVDFREVPPGITDWTWRREVATTKGRNFIKLGLLHPCWSINAVHFIICVIWQQPGVDHHIVNDLSLEGVRKQYKLGPSFKTI